MDRDPAASGLSVRRSCCHEEGGTTNRCANGGLHLAVVALKFGLCHTWLLEIELIEYRIVRLRHEARRSRCSRLSGAVWDTEPDHASKAVRPDERGVPRHRCSPVVSDDDGFTLFERIEQTNHVTNKVEERKLVYGLRALRLTVTTHIGSDGMEA